MCGGLVTQKADAVLERASTQHANAARSTGRRRRSFSVIRLRPAIIIGVCPCSTLLLLLLYRLDCGITPQHNNLCVYDSSVCAVHGVRKSTRARAINHKDVTPRSLPSCKHARAHSSCNTVRYCIQLRRGTAALLLLLYVRTLFGATHFGYLCFYTGTNCFASNKCRTTARLVR